MFAGREDRLVSPAFKLSCDDGLRWGRGREERGGVAGEWLVPGPGRPLGWVGHGWESRLDPQGSRGYRRVPSRGAVCSDLLGVLNV